MSLLIRKYLPSKIKLIVPLIIFFSLFINSESFSQWYVQYYSPNQFTVDVRFINKKTGWACGSSAILKTTNGGNNWFQQNNPTSGYLTQIHPVNDSVVYVCGWYVILKTTDGGNNWKIVRVGQEQTPQLDGLWFINENTGWFCGDRVVMKTTNGGNTFIDSTRLSNSTYDIHFKNDSTGVIAGYSKMFRTTNSGTNWYSVILPSTVATPFCDRVTFIGDTGWTASWGNVVFRTTNYGVSWDSITRIPRSNSSDATYCIEFSNKNTGYSGGDNGKIYRTTNGGFNWALSANLGVGPFTSIYSLNDSNVWAVGGPGSNYIIFTSNGGLTFINNNSLNEIKNFNLKQNYPNPFNSETNIKVIINISKFVKIIVYNHLGKDIKVLSDKFLKSGEYTFKFDGSSLPSGVYYFKVNTVNYSETKKMILIR